MLLSRRQAVSTTLLLCRIDATKESRLLHLVMQRDRIPVIPIRPSERPVLDEDTREIRSILERLRHRPCLLANERKIAHADGPIGKLDFQFITAERANADHVDHHS